MNTLLIFFAIPLATIILSAIFETFIKCPLKVAGIAFSIFIIVAFALGGSAELIVAAIIYTLLSLITAFITMLIQNRVEENDNSDDCDDLNLSSNLSSVNNREILNNYTGYTNTNELYNYNNSDDYNLSRLNGTNEFYNTTNLNNSNEYYNINKRSNNGRCNRR